MQKFNDAWASASTFKDRERRTKSFGQFAEVLESEGFEADLLTFTFDQLPGRRDRVHAAMFREVERVYRMFLTRAVRNPTAPSGARRLPIWLCGPDYPVFKHHRERSVEVFVNDGAHIHVVALTPVKTRLRERLREHFERKRAMYAGVDRPLREIHVEPIEHQLSYVVEYALKALTSGRVDGDELLVLPRSLYEVIGEAAMLRRAAR